MAPIDADSDVAVFAACGSSDCPATTGIGGRTNVGAIVPSEDARGWVIVQQGSQLVRSERIV